VRKGLDVYFLTGKEENPYDQRGVTISDCH